MWVDADLRRSGACSGKTRQGLHALHHLRAHILLDFAHIIFHLHHTLDTRTVHFDGLHTLDYFEQIKKIMNRAIQATYELR